MAELSAQPLARARGVHGKVGKGSRAQRKGEAHQATEAGLDLLRVLGWLVLHDAAVPGEPDNAIDHVLAGPSGVYIVNTVSWPGAINMRDDVLTVGGTNRTEALGQVSAAADAVRALLGGVPVAPMLCFERLETVAGVVGDVALCASENILDLLTGQPEILSSAAFAKASRTISTSCRPGVRPTSPAAAAVEPATEPEAAPAAKNGRRTGARKAVRSPEPPARTSVVPPAQPTEDVVARRAQEAPAATVASAEDITRVAAFERLMMTGSTETEVPPADVLAEPVEDLVVDPVIDPVIEPVLDLPDDAASAQPNTVIGDAGAALWRELTGSPEEQGTTDELVDVDAALAEAEAWEREVEEAEAREREAREERELAQRLAEEAVAQERAEREAQEAREREAEDLAAQEVRERKAREAFERVQQEALELTRQEEQELAEREAQKVAEREAAERAEQEAREAAERAEQEAREQVEREAREAAELEARQAAEREAAELAEQEARAAADRAEQEAREQAEQEARAAAELEAAEREAAELAEQGARAAAERAEQEAREQAEQEARAAAEREAAELAEQEAREAAEREAAELAEQEAREAAERAEQEAREQAEQKARAAAEQEAAEQEAREAAKRAEREARKLAKREAREAREAAEREAAELAELEEQVRVEREQAVREAGEARVRAELDAAAEAAEDLEDDDEELDAEQEARERAAWEALKQAARAAREREQRESEEAWSRQLEAHENQMRVERERTAELYEALQPAANKSAETDPLTESVSGSREHGRRRAMLTVALGALLVAVVMIAVPHVPGAVAWAQHLIGKESPTSIGTTVPVKATTGHPDVKVLAGTPVSAQPGPGAKVAKGHHLIAVPIRLENQGTTRWELPLAAKTTAVDNLGVALSVARTVPSVKGLQVLGAQAKVAPGKVVTGYVVFSVQNGRTISSISLVLGQSADDSVTWQVAP